MHLKSDLLLLHGALGASSQFNSLAEKLCHRFNIYTFDFTGHGKSSATVDDLSIESFTAQLKDFVQDNGLDGCDVFGFSMGGYVALNALSEDPALFRKVLTLGTKFRWDPVTAEKESAMLDPRKIEAKVPQYAQSLKELHGSNWEDLLHKTARFMQQLGNRPVLSDDKLKGIRSEVLLCVGEKDKMVTREETSHVAGLINNCGFSVLPYTPHPLEQVDVDQLSNLLTWFIGR